MNWGDQRQYSQEKCAKARPEVPVRTILTLGSTFHRLSTRAPLPLRSAPSIQRTSDARLIQISSAPITKRPLMILTGRGGASPKSSHMMMMMMMMMMMVAMVTMVTMMMMMMMMMLMMKSPRAPPSPLL